jgi:hypothetical protein
MMSIGVTGALSNPNDQLIMMNLIEQQGSD